MRCARCQRDVGTVYFVGEEEVCRWCCEPDEWNVIATLVAQEEAERG
jgi:recombinational DNA repair protein (RecF pathway)